MENIYWLLRLIRDFLWVFIGLIGRPFFIKNYFKNNSVRCLHVGCGPILLKNWLNTDILPKPFIMTYINAKNKLPFANETFDYIYSEHVIEHIPIEFGRKFIFECSRVLKPGGKLRIATPDLQFLINLYNKPTQKDNLEYSNWVYNSIPTVRRFGTAVIINNFMHSWGHKFIYDQTALTEMMQEAKFKVVTRTPCGESDDSVLVDLEQHGTVISKQFNILETMVLECQK